MKPYLSQALISTPLGNMTAIISEKGLFILTFEEESQFIRSRIRLYYPSFSIRSGVFSHALAQIQDWIAHYFSSMPKATLPGNLPSLDLCGSTFATTIWTTLLQIPLNKTSSYGQLAEKAGFPNAARAVGKVVGLNPIALIIPCHRIIGKKGALTGYRSGVDRKRWLLEHEKEFN